MDEYINKQTVIDYLNGYLHTLGDGSADTLFDRGQRRALINTIQDILAVKAADAQPMKRGKWIKHDVVKVLCSGETLNGFCQCTACGDVFSFHYSDHNYCPNCGARMDLEDGESNGRI